MHIAIDLPDDIVATLQATCPDMTRLVLESLALEGYRSRQLYVGAPLYSDRPHV